MMGMKFDDEKLRYDLVPPVVLKQLAAVLTFGAKKYGPNNWQNVPNGRDRYYAAMMRHIQADRAGELYDDETGLPHLTHALACVAFMLHNTVTAVAEPKCEPVPAQAAIAKPKCEPAPVQAADDELDELLEWLGPTRAQKFLANATELPAIAMATPRDYVSGAFIWGDTPEGRTYWAKVDRDWRAYLESRADKPAEAMCSPGPARSKESYADGTRSTRELRDYQRRLVDEDLGSIFKDGPQRMTQELLDKLLAEREAEDKEAEAVSAVLSALLGGPVSLVRRG